jgi:protease IV
MGRSMSGKKVAALVIIGVVFLSLVALIVARPTSRVASGDAIALIRLSGGIQETTTTSLFSGGGISPDVVEDRLELAQEDPSVRAIVLRLESPGGTVGASQQIAHLVADAKKPIVISMADVVASGGYYISAQADRIVAQPGTLTGSIGVIWATIDPGGLLKKLGVKLDAITAGKHKDMFLPGRLNRERRKIIQNLVDDMYDQFVTDVAQGRGLNESDVRDLATGELYTGEQALRLGLVDATGFLDDAINEAESLAGIEDAEVVELTPSFFEQFFGGAGGRVMDSIFGPETLDPRIATLREVLTGYTVPRYELP